MYGWRARIGQLYPSAGLTGEQELARMAPEGVSIYTTRIKLSRATHEQEMQMGDHAEEAASLLADARVDFIAFNCTMASLIKGPGYDQELISRITEATSIPATTTTTAVLEALKHLRMNNLVLVTPYRDETNEIERAFLRAHGYRVLADRGLGLQDPYEQAAIDPGTWYKLVKGMRHPSANGYFVSCAGIQVVEVIRQLEIDLGRPVITSNQALMWHCLTRLGINEPVQGFGKLLSGEPL